MPMAIDLSGLFLTDVEILLEGNGFKVRSHRQFVLDETLSLPAPILSMELTKGCVWVNPYGTDLVALAERLANTWESQGCKVKRLVDNREIQSFVLA
jgi:hypothetical protein